MTMSLKKLVVGLGNYSLPSTRHSVGMAALNKLAEHLGVKWVYEKKCSGYIANHQTERIHIVLLKPRLAMNINGKSILKAVNTYSVSTENIILLQDDLDKPVGKFRLKVEGSASGHNGVRSAMSSLNTDKLKRYKIGIGRPHDRSQVVDYVLGDFGTNERHVIEETLRTFVNVLLDDLELNDRAIINNQDVISPSYQDKISCKVNNASMKSEENREGFPD